MLYRVVQPNVFPEVDDGLQKVVEGNASEEEMEIFNQKVQKVLAAFPDDEYKFNMSEAFRSLSPPQNIKNLKIQHF